MHTPTSTEISGLIERVGFCAYFGWSEAPDCGSASIPSRDFITSSIAFERRAMKIGWPRQLITICAPSTRALMSWLTGAPAKRARALGLQDLMKGTAANPAPTAPTTAVVAVRNLRRPVLTSSLAIPHSEKYPKRLRRLAPRWRALACRKRRGSVTERLTDRQSARGPD